jgi:hypothetical protein
MDRTSSGASPVVIRPTSNGFQTEPWSEMDIRDLKGALAYGNTFADTASMLCRNEDEVRQKATELGLVERPGKIVRVFL